ncbi:hypothetical protein [Methylobacterium sp. E-046]|uniref:hypothetical protein n=1 Tax=Methylobacterium sp. E-046 TaxID=2836576 RepID=UPI001FB8D4A7|nr:hypothetical protein [Methylobacterium sp. E-046]MCJ2103102.1 hypothetical protein [Methylobacterium sp. E-046]
MPFYDFTLGQLSGPTSFKRFHVDASDLESAIREATTWAKHTRRHSGRPNDMSDWPLVILAGEGSSDLRPGTMLFELKDVLPD